MLDIFCVSARSKVPLEHSLRQQRFRVFEVEGAVVHDEASLFTAFIHGAPMGDASAYSELDWTRPSGWDAFEDFLWQGLAELQGERVAILWNAADSVSANNLCLLI